MSSPATHLNEVPVGTLASVSGAVADMSALQREFARAYVLNGGNATKAAVEAGYGDADPSKAGRRCLVNPKVLHEIKRLMIANTEAYLPIAIRVLVEIACDPECDPRARVQAANSLLDRGGMAAPKGGVQVNVGVQVNGGQVQALIGEIWDAKKSRMSDIPPAMPDIAQAQIAAPLGDPAPSFASLEGGGGCNSRVPPPGPRHYLPTPTRSISISRSRLVSAGSRPGITTKTMETTMGVSGEFWARMRADGVVGSSEPRLPLGRVDPEPLPRWMVTSEPDRGSWRRWGFALCAVSTAVVIMIGGMVFEWLV